MDRGLVQVAWALRTPDMLQTPRNGDKTHPTGVLPHFFVGHFGGCWIFGDFGFLLGLGVRLGFFGIGRYSEFDDGLSWNLYLLLRLGIEAGASLPFLL